MNDVPPEGPEGGRLGGPAAEMQGQRRQERRNRLTVARVRPPAHHVRSVRSQIIFHPLVHILETRQ